MKVKKLVAGLVLGLTLTTAMPAVLPETSLGVTVEAAAKKKSNAKLNVNSATVVIGKPFQLRVTGTTKKVKWSTSKKKIATVSKTGLITGKKAGKTVITAKVDGKKLKCTVLVVKATPQPKPAAQPKPAPQSKPATQSKPAAQKPVNKMYAGVAVKNGVRVAPAIWNDGFFQLRIFNYGQSTLRCGGPGYLFSVKFTMADGSTIVKTEDRLKSLVNTKDMNFSDIPSGYYADYDAQFGIDGSKVRKIEIMNMCFLNAYGFPYMTYRGPEVFHISVQVTAQ